jgi:hypothetical protein
MSKFSDTGIPTIGELTGTAPDVKAEGKECDYCRRGWSKGFAACPQCGLEAPPWCDDCCSRHHGECPEGP